jgi:hypothetical protein
VDPLAFASGVPLTEHNFHLVSGFTCARPGQPEDRYEEDVSRWLTDPGRGGARERILGGLVEEVERRGRFPFFALYVDPDNPAQELYKEFGFQVLDVWSDPAWSARSWVRMVRRIPL